MAVAWEGYLLVSRLGTGSAINPFKRGHYVISIPIQVVPCLWVYQQKNKMYKCVSAACNSSFRPNGVCLSLHLIHAVLPISLHSTQSHSLHLYSMEPRTGGFPAVHLHCATVWVE